MGLLDDLAKLIGGGVNTAVNAVNDVAKQLPGNQRSTDTKTSNKTDEKDQSTVKQTKDTSAAKSSSGSQSDLSQWLQNQSSTISKIKTDAEAGQSPYTTAQVASSAPQGSSSFQKAVDAAMSRAQEQNKAIGSQEQDGSHFANVQPVAQQAAEESDALKDANGNEISPEIQQRWQQANPDSDISEMNVEVLPLGLGYVDRSKVDENERQSPTSNENIGSFLNNIKQWTQDIGLNIPESVREGSSNLNDVNENMGNISGEGQDAALVTAADGTTYDTSTAEGKYEAAMQMIEADGTDSFIKQFSEAVDGGALKREDGTTISLADFDKGDGTGNERYAQFFVDTALPDYHTLLSDPNFVYYYDGTWSEMGIDISTEEGLDKALNMNDAEFAELYKQTDEYTQTVMDNFQSDQMSGLGGDYESQQAILGLLGTEAAEGLKSNGILDQTTIDAIYNSDDASGYMTALLSALSNNSELDYLNGAGQDYNRAATAAKRFSQSNQGMSGESMTPSTQSSRDVDGTATAGRTLEQTGHTEAPRSTLLNTNDLNTYSVSRAGNMKALQDAIDDEDEIYWY